jgi:UDP-4-amino-4,6-dideoxy-N-acetyl-beta-L-altrosamine transaminase
LQAPPKREKRGTQDTATRPLPYGRQWIDEDDIAAVVEVLRSDWLTTGPLVEEFERSVSQFTGSSYAVAVSSGTAALHSAMFAIGIGEGDEVIVPPMTFAATVNCVLYQGARPVFADVDPETLLIDPAKVAEKITARTRAIIAVDYAGQPCDYDALREVAGARRIALVADACHSLGATYKNRAVGSLGDLTAFSFHPVKHITTGEGGMVTTANPESAARLRTFRNHGITTEHRQRAQRGSWFYEMTQLGYNYRITDFQCALGCSQLRKLPRWLERRRQIAAMYDEAFLTDERIRPLSVRADVSCAWHLYPAQIHGVSRQSVFSALRSAGIGANVHYIPVHLHPYYRQYCGGGVGLCPVSEAAYERLLSLPMFPMMEDDDVQRVIEELKRAIQQ